MNYKWALPLFLLLFGSTSFLFSQLPSGLLNPSKYHELRAGLKNSQLKFERDQKGRVAFLGGSITYNSGWRDSIELYLTQRFPETKFEFIRAGIPSMGTTPAAFRLERDVLFHGPIDLLFEEAAVNDATNGRSDTEQIRGMEGIIRRLRKVNPNMDIVMMHFVDPDKIESYNKGVTPQVIRNHEQVAEHYQVPTINLAKEVRDRIDQGEFSWDADFKNLHPSPFGQGVYTYSMLTFLENAYAKALSPAEELNPFKLPDPIDLQAYDQGYLLDFAHAKLLQGWSVEVSWNPRDGTGTRANYVDVPMLVGETPGSSLELSFEGRAIGIAIAAGKDAGMIEYRIDGKEWTSLNLFTRWSEHLHLPWYYTLATSLSEGKHLLEIRIADKKDEKSQGHACRIRYFYVNQ